MSKTAADANIETAAYLLSEAREILEDVHKSSKYDCAEAISAIDDSIGEVCGLVLGGKPLALPAPDVSTSPPLVEQESGPLDMLSETSLCCGVA